MAPRIPDDYDVPEIWPEGMPLGYRSTTIEPDIESDDNYTDTQLNRLGINTTQVIDISEQIDVQVDTNNIVSQLDLVTAELDNVRNRLLTLETEHQILKDKYEHLSFMVDEYEDEDRIFGFD